MILEVSIRKRLGTFQLHLDKASSAKTLGVLGHSGSGKTMLLNCIAGLLQPDGGRIAVRGNVLVDVSGGLSAAAARRRVGYVFQDGLLFPHLSVERNLRYGVHRETEGPGFEDVVDVLEIGGLLARSPRTLSGGEARRVAIGRALLSGPQLLLLDEPLSGLDRAMAVKTLHYLKQVAESFSIPIVYVSHTPSDILYLCEEAWVLENGRLIASGAPHALLMRGATSNAMDHSELYTVFRATGKLRARRPRSVPGR